MLRSKTDQARVSEVAALQCSDVEPETITSGGTIHRVYTRWERGAR